MAAGFGSLAQLGNQSIGQSIGYGISKAQQGDSFNQWKKSLKRGPRYTAIGLERAGINRILAAGGGIGATSAGGALKANAAGSGSPGENPATAKAQYDLLKMQGRKADAEAVLLEAQIPGANNDRIFNMTEEGYQTNRQRRIRESQPTNALGIINQGIRDMSGGANASDIMQRLRHAIPGYHQPTNPDAPRNQPKKKDKPFEVHFGQPNGK